MSYDPECRKLAEHFLPSMASERLKDKMAQHIQDCVEGWLQMEMALIRDNIVQPAPAGTIIVHLLREGLPACGFLRKVPAEWPEGHKWEGLDRIQDVNCPRCLATLQPPGAPKSVQ